MTTFTIRTEHPSGGSMTEHLQEADEVNKRVYTFLSDINSIEGTRHACERLIVVPTHTMWCGHREYARTDYCTEMTCTNYVGRRVDNID